MNKVIITLIAIMVVIGAIFTAMAIFTPKIAEDIGENIETRISEEEILDDCTDEYEEMEIDNTVKANTQEEKTSPNCALITKTYFSKCGHTKSEYANLPQELVNLTRNEIVLKQEKTGECGEHYIVQDKDGQVAIYQILEDGNKKEIEVTGVTTEYLPETDKINMKNVIQVNGKQELNQLIEDYE